MDVQAPCPGSRSKLRCLHPSLSFSSSSKDSKHKPLQNSRSYDPSSGGCHEDPGPGAIGEAPVDTLTVPPTRVSRSTSPFSFYRSRFFAAAKCSNFSKNSRHDFMTDRCNIWFRKSSGKNKIEKQKKIPDEFLSPTSPLSICPGPYEICSRKVMIKSYLVTLSQSQVTFHDQEFVL